MTGPGGDAGFEQFAAAVEEYESDRPPRRRCDVSPVGALEGGTGDDLPRSPCRASPTRASHGHRSSSVSGIPADIFAMFDVG